MNANIFCHFLDFSTCSLFQKIETKINTLSGPSTNWPAFNLKQFGTHTVFDLISEQSA